MQVTKTDSDCAELLAPIIYNLTRIVSPHALIMEYDTQFPADNINAMIEELLMSKYKMPKATIPAIYNASRELRNSYFGLGINVQEAWLKNITLS